MPTVLLVIFSAFLFIMPPDISWAAPLKTYVSEFSVAGTANKEELKATLQGLLASRLNSSQIKLVESPDKAELHLAGSYALFGKMFSIDVLIKNTLSGAISKVFEQGESQDDLIPAFGRLAQKVDQELAKTLTVAASPITVSSPAPAPAATPIAAPVAAYKVETAPAAPENSYLVKTANPGNPPGSWTSDQLSGVFRSLALGRTLPSGEREIFVAGEQTIRYLRKGTELIQVAELAMPVSAKILALDTADLDRDGTPELYVTIVDRKTVSSRVYQPSGTGLELIADNQPWLYRGAGTDFSNRTIFVQGLNSSGEYSNGVAELAKSGRQFETSKSRILPRPGHIFNSTRFNDATGAEKLVVIDGEGYLHVYAADNSELWKSSDKYGGSETFFNYETVAQLRAKGDRYSWNFLEQRITVLPGGNLIVPRNDAGTFSIGNNRSYNKHSLYGLQWSGSMLKEKWHTRLTPSYLADYAYDAATHEVVLLEVVQQAGLLGTGKTVVSINKLD
ncbi:FG-GAP repeat domain-containing protein [Pelotalea chapellei]|uniref:VCBS repeat-containing protein n=1 Tax=Pelotalea chapellei TaxID=44671 RepID=A0ABS5U4I8_9BACT|nr:VCBS repeat-containing protein [Pelotalea chapellei]MBT1070570.1 VCBS repeat-containing protein [Pelotalea chapellei]